MSATGSEEIFRLRLTDFDCYDHLSPTAVLDIFQDLATENSIDMGMGRDDLNPNGMFWVVIRQKFEIFPEAGVHAHQKVRVKTWPHSPNRMHFMRDYSMHTLDGQMVAKGTSEWLLLGIEDRRIIPALDVYQGPTDFCEDRMFDEKLRKIKDFEGPAEPALIATPQFTDVDTNMHVNNARYANFISNAIEQSPDRALRTIQMEYRHELMPHREIQVYTMEDEAGTHVKVVNDEGEVAFMALLTY